MPNAFPQISSPENGQPLLEVRQLSVSFPVREGVLKLSRRFCEAVRTVNLSLAPGQTLGIVGESGCGKTTLGKAICRLVPLATGELILEGTPFHDLPQRALKPIRRRVQMVFQDPAESLNARETVGNLIEEPLIIHRLGNRPERRRRVLELLDLVGLPASAADRFPFEFSGGQRQRIGIARALSLQPDLIVCDEPVSALDVSVQSQILNLLLELQNRLGLAYIFISHDLSVVRHVADRVAVMYLGEIVEEAPSALLFRNPLHGYTRALISAIPRTNPTERRQRILLRGEVPSPIDPPPGCAFAARSHLSFDPDTAHVPPLYREVEPSHWVQIHPATVENPTAYGWTH